MGYFCFVLFRHGKLPAALPIFVPMSQFLFLFNVHSAVTVAPSAVVKPGPTAW